MTETPQKKARKGRKRHPANTSDLARAGVGRDDKGRFLPGVSGNINGRREDQREMKALARTYTVEAIEHIVRLMRGAEDERVQFLAAQELLDRGHGRPAPALASGPLVNITMAGAAPITDVHEAARVYKDLMSGAIDVQAVTLAPALPEPGIVEEQLR